MGRRDIDIVGAGKVVGVRGPQKPEAIRQRFQDTFTVDHSILFGLSLEDCEDQLLLAEVCGPLNLEIPGDLIEFGDVTLL